MFLRGEFSGKELSGQMAGATNQLPECLEELGIPDKGIVQVFQDEGSHSGRLAGSPLPTFVAIHAVKLRTAIQAVLIWQVLLFIFRV